MGVVYIDTMMGVVYIDTMMGVVYIDTMTPNMGTVYESVK